MSSNHVRSDLEESVVRLKLVRMEPQSTTQQNLQAFALLLVVEEVVASSLL